MDLKEFERQALAGEITDFEPYFEDEDLNYHIRYILAKNGIEVNRIIKMDGPGTILGFIKDKVHIDRYKEWKNHPNVAIRQALARTGYFEDHYYNDPKNSVREIVIQNNVRKALTRIRSDNDLAVIKNQLFNLVEFDIDILSAYINKEKQYARKYQYDFNDNVNNIAFQLKLDAINHIPTTIEKTMNEVQLFDVHCPLWVKPYTPNQISKILWTYKYVTKQGYTNFTQVLFETFHEKEHTFQPKLLEDLVIKNLKERN
jgi:hypothetical protein